MNNEDEDTAPSSSSSSSAAAAARHPRNMQGLLRFALEATAREDAPHPSNFAEIDPERKKFLEDAIKSMTVDVVDLLGKAIVVLTDVTSTEADQIEALEIIMDYIDNLSAANDFCVIGGLNLLIPCLNSPYVSVQAKTANLIGELTQNNSHCQNILLQINALPKLIELLSDSATASVAIHAISCMIRNFEPGIKAFIDIGGIECILGCVQSDQEKVVIRSIFLMNSICVENPQIRDDFIKLNAVEIIIGILKVSQDNIRLETALSALNVLTTNVNAVRRCQEPQLNLHQILNEINQVSAGRPACQEIIVYCQSILEKIFNTSTDNTDR